MVLLFLCKASPIAPNEVPMFIQYYVTLKQCKRLRRDLRSHESINFHIFLFKVIKFQSVQFLLFNYYNAL